MYTKSDIIDLLMRDDRAVARALLVLNDRQTSDERIAESTKHSNNRGFNAAHAKRGTSMANFYLRNGFLTSKQLAWWRVEVRGVPRIGIYAGQLLEEAKEKTKRQCHTQ